MTRAACHCTAARLVTEAAPEWVNDCDCPLCRRYRALWAYYEPGQVSLLRGDRETDSYCWDDRLLEFHRCKTCGCVTHAVALTDTPFIAIVNARKMPNLDRATVRIQQKDNAQTGLFWTRSDGPVVASRHPPMPRPGPDAAYVRVSRSVSRPRD